MGHCVAPFLTVSPQLVAAVAETCAVRDPVGYLEKLVVSGQIESLPLFLSEKWRHFRAEAQQVFERNDCVALRGFPTANDGSALLVAALTIGESLRTYRDGKVIKQFKMSPWTTELSHTTRAGEFHTDLNVEPRPPAITAIQCLEPDPGSPDYGITRVTRLAHLLEFVDRHHDNSTRRFLREDSITMLNDRSSAERTGTIVENGVIRYHPETLRAAARRSGDLFQGLEHSIASVERAAMSVSIPFDLQRGDILLLSNHRTLHCRGESSVVFQNYPMGFDSRRVSVLHATQERQKS